jgi:hypothetical protein
VPLFDANFTDEGGVRDRLGPLGSDVKIGFAETEPVTLVCSSEAYHNAADRWPEAVDVATLARYVNALVNGALELAQQQG